MFHVNMLNSFECNLKYHFFIQEIIKKMANNNPAILPKGKKTKEDTKPKEIIHTTTSKGMVKESSIILE